MSKPRVYNKRETGISPDAIYVGRPTKWGNPFIIGRDGNRAEVIAKYEEKLRASPLMMRELAELRGKSLVCWCAPLPCHADVLLRLANERP